MRTLHDESPQVVNRDDLVPRLSVKSVQGLLESLLE